MKNVQSPTGIDRRVSDPELYSRVAPAAMIKTPFAAEPIILCPDHEYFVSVVEEQVKLAQQMDVPIHLVLAELILEEESTGAKLHGESAVGAAAKIFRSHLRSTDLIVRYRQKTVGLLLPDSDELATERLCTRLASALSRRLFFGKESIKLVPIFGVSNNISRFGNPGESLIALADLQLDSVKHGLGLV